MTDRPNKNDPPSTVPPDVSANVLPDVPAIVLTDVRVGYDEEARPALHIDSLTIAAGEKIAVIGSSGAGKTSLVRLVNGLVRPRTGDAVVLGVNLSDPAARRRVFRRRIGCVFQEFNLVERASVFRNVLFGRLGWMHPLTSFLGWFSETDTELAGLAIRETGLGEYADRRVDSLSGGQRQRVAVARALAQNPEILTADEPVSNLDPVLAEDILALIAGAAEGRGAALMMIVHHPSLAQRYADRVIGLRDGRIVYDSATGAPLDARAQREIYGRNLPLEPVPDEDGDRWDSDANDGRHPIHVA